MDRSPVFSAIKALRSGQAFNQNEVDAVDKLLDLLGVPKLAGAATTGVQIGLSTADFAKTATTLGCTTAQIRAVWEVESGGGWFKDVRADILALDGPGGFLDGPHLPKILFEAHIFDRYTEGRFRASHPNLSSARWDRKLYVGGQGEYIRLWKAMALDRRAALLSASVGGAQIRGFNHKAAGFETTTSRLRQRTPSTAERCAGSVAQRQINLVDQRLVARVTAQIFGKQRGRALEHLGLRAA